MNNLPLVSILLPILNKAGTIERCLIVLLAQDYPADHVEILIADGMSTDDPRRPIWELAELHPENPIKSLNPTANNI